MSDVRFDVVFGGNDECYLTPHFCRVWEDGEGCYGTNTNHGFSFEDAREEAARYYENKAAEIRNTRITDWT